MMLLVIYHLVAVLVGFFIAYFGYRLFCQGIGERAGDLRAETRGIKIVATRLTPGTFFALLGAAIIAVTVWRGINVVQTVTTPSMSSQNEYSGAHP